MCHQPKNLALFLWPGGIIVLFSLAPELTFSLLKLRILKHPKHCLGKVYGNLVGYKRTKQSWLNTPMTVNAQLHFEIFSFCNLIMCQKCIFLTLASNLHHSILCSTGEAYSGNGHVSKCILLSTFKLPFQAGRTAELNISSVMKTNV